MGGIAESPGEGHGCDSLAGRDWEPCPTYPEPALRPRLQGSGSMPQPGLSPNSRLGCSAPPPRPSGRSNGRLTLDVARTELLTPAPLPSLPGFPVLVDDPASTRVSDPRPRHHPPLPLPPSSHPLTATPSARAAVWTSRTCPTSVHIPLSPRLIPQSEQPPCLAKMVASSLWTERCPQPPVRPSGSPSSPRPPK